MIEYIELRLYNTALTDYVLLPNFSTSSFDVKYNDIGVLNFSYPLAQAKSLGLVDQRTVGVCLGFSDGTSKEVERYNIDNTNDDGVNSENERVRALTGRSTMSYLEDAVVYPSNWPVTAPTGHDFTDQSVGSIMRTLIARAKARGTLTQIDETTFTGTQDSNNVPWGVTHSQKYASGTGYYQLLNDFMERGLVDAWMDGRNLRMLKGGTRGIHTNVTAGRENMVLNPGQNVSELSTTTNSTESASAVLMEGEEGTALERVSATAQTDIGRRKERYVSQGGIKDAGVLTLLGDAELSLYGRIPREETVGLANAAVTPFQHFDVADWVPVRFEGTDAPVERRVRQLAVAVNETRDITLGITLNTVLYEQDVALKRRMDQYTGQGGAYGSVLDQNTDNTIPNPPSSVSATSGFYISRQGEYLGVLALNWVAPTTNVDGSPFSDFARYDVNWRYLGDPTWGTDYPTTNTGWQFSPISPSREVQYRVRAVDTSGHASEWSTVGTHTMASDVTPPPVASTPVVTSGDPVLLAWNGKTAAGNDMPFDFLWVEIWQSPNSGFTPGDNESKVVGTMSAQGIFNIRSGIPDQTYYYKLVALDRARNRAAASAQADGYLVENGDDLTDPPAGSPTLSVYAGPGSAMLTWTPPIDARTKIDIHVAMGVNGGPPSGPPDTSTLRSQDSKPIGLVTTFPDNATPIPVDTDTYFALVARNERGSAPASSWVAGRAGKIDPDMLNLVAGTLTANNVLAEAVQTNGIQIGTGTWDQNAFDVPGIFRVPFDGTPASMTVQLNAVSAVIKNLRLSGQSNFIDGGLDLASGVSKPTSAPRLSFGWDNPVTYDVFPGMEAYGTNMRGLAEDDTYWYFTHIVGNGSNVYRAHKTDKTISQVRFIAGEHSHGGLVKIGSEWLVLCYNITAGGYRVYRYDLNWNAVGSWVYSGRSGGRTPMIGTTGADAWIAQVGPAESGTGQNPIQWFYRHNATTGAYIDAYGLSSGVGLSAVTGFYCGPSDFGSSQSNPYLYVTVDNLTWMYYLTTNNGLNALQNYPTYAWSGANGEQVYGLTYASSRFWSLSATGRLWKYSRQPVANYYVTSAFSFYDSDTGGTGTHETQVGPVDSRLWPVRRWARIDVDLAADSGGADDPDSFLLYAKAGADQSVSSLALQTAQGQGQGYIMLDRVTTGGVAPRTTNQFDTVPGTLGAVRSIAYTGSNPSLELRGDGGWRLDSAKDLNDTGWISVGPQSVVVSPITPGLFRRGWTNYDNRTLQYRRVGGRCYFRGIIRSGTIGQEFMYLPVGFRPESRVFTDHHFAVPSNSAFGLVRVSGDGYCDVSTGSNVWVDLTGVSWFVAG